MQIYGATYDEKFSGLATYGGFGEVFLFTDAAQKGRNVKALAS